MTPEIINTRLINYYTSLQPDAALAREMQAVKLNIHHQRGSKKSHYFENEFQIGNTTCKIRGCREYHKISLISDAAKRKLFIENCEAVIPSMLTIEDKVWINFSCEDLELVQSIVQAFRALSFKDRTSSCADMRLPTHLKEIEINKHPVEFPVRLSCRELPAMLDRQREELTSKFNACIYRPQPPMNTTQTIEVKTAKKYIIDQSNVTLTMKTTRAGTTANILIEPPHENSLTIISEYCIENAIKLS